MRSNCVGQVRKNLLREGLPTRYVNKIISELSEHWEDLKREGMVESVPLEIAEARADQRLGNPEELARAISSKMRSTCWLGRHPGLGFAILPLVAVVIWWVVLLLLGTWLSGGMARLNDKDFTKVNWDLMGMWIRWTGVTGGIVLPALLCYLARRRFCGFKWALIACGVLALHNFFHSANLIPPGLEIGSSARFTWAYGFRWGFSHPSLVPLALPLLVFLFFWIIHFRKTASDCQQQINVKTDQL
jgi:hypothetical protein